MSCERQGSRIAATAAIGTGINTVTSKAGNIIGAVSNKIGDQVAGVVQAGQASGQTMLSTAKRKADAAIEQWAEPHGNIRPRRTGAAF